MIDWKDGMYAMHRFGLVIVRDPKNGRCGIEYLQDYGESRGDITKPLNGGGSCWTVGFDELARVTDPVLVLRALYTESHRDEKRLEASLACTRDRMAKLSHSLHAIKQARDIAAADEDTPSQSPSTEEP